MRCTMLAGLAAVAVVAMSAGSPAEAQNFKSRSAAGPNAAAATPATTKLRRTRSAPQGAQNLKGNDQVQKFPGHAAAIQALSLYYRRCLDNMLPECPK